MSENVTSFQPLSKVKCYKKAQCWVLFSQATVCKVWILASLPLADQHHVGIAPVFEHTRQDSPEGEEETGENYGATS